MPLMRFFFSSATDATSPADRVESQSKCSPGTTSVDIADEAELEVGHVRKIMNRKFEMSGDEEEQSKQIP